MRPASILVLCLILGACGSVGPDHLEPRPPMPEGYQSELLRGLDRAPAEMGAWWAKLGDPELDRIVQETVAANLDLRAAASRIAEARARRGIVAADRLPSVDMGADYERRQNSREVPGGDFFPRTTHAHAAGFDAVWEIDLWGRIARGIEAADAEVEAEIEDYRDVLVVMIAEAAINYLDLRTAQERLRIARSNLDAQRKTVELTEVRFSSGLVSGLDVAQARTLLESTRATIPPLEANARAAANRLAVLSGVHPGSLEDRLRTARPIPVGPAELAVGVPADLLRRRADIRRSERALAVQTARIGVAEAELYPNLSLFGNFGLSADDFLSLFSRPAATSGFGPSLNFNVFDRDRLHAAVEVETARQEQALLFYEQTVLLALEEVENAMTDFVREQIRRDSLEVAQAQSALALDLSQDQYREGLVDFERVLSSQLSLFRLEDQIAENRAAISLAMIRLYKAVGGGWEHFEPDHPASSENSMESGR